MTVESNFLGELADGTRGAIPPWGAPRPADGPWRGPACEAASYLGELVSVAQSGACVALPRQMAILWEQRDDLRRIYDVGETRGCDAYIAWCLTTGIEEGLIIPAAIAEAFWEALDSPADAPGYYNDMPISRGLAIFRVARDADTPETSETGDSQLWLEPALWMLLTAAAQYRWPAAMTKSLRAYANAPVPALAVHGVALPRLLHMVWDSRADLRSQFDLSREEGRSGLLRWLLLVGLAEFGASRDALPGDFRHRLRDGAWFEKHGIGQVGDDPLADNAPEPARGAPRVRVIRGASPPSIVLTGRIHAPSGRGEDIRMTMRALAAQQVPFVTLDRDDGMVRDPEGQTVDPDIVAEASVNILHLNADSAFVDHQFLRRYDIGKARLIGYWAWELAKFPAEFYEAFSFVDEVWAATRFAHDAFDMGYRPVRLMPMAVEMPGRELPALDRGYFRLPMFRFLFLFNLDFNSYVARKNPAAAIAAFRRAFPRGEERVALLVKTINAESHPAEWRDLQNVAGNDPRIILRNGKYSREEMSRLISLCDCYVSLHRSEGFGRGPAEAMLHGKPVIATNYSGNTDFMHADNSFLVDYTLVRVAEGEYPGADEQIWAEPDIGHAAAQMRRVYEDPERAREFGARAARFMRARHGAIEIGRQYCERLCALEPQLADRLGMLVTAAGTGIPD